MATNPSFLDLISGQGFNQPGTFADRFNAAGGPGGSAPFNPYPTTPPPLPSGWQAPPPPTAAQMDQWWNKPPPTAAAAPAQDTTTPDASQPTQGLGQPVQLPKESGGIGSVLSSNKNAMVGMGLGLLGGGNQWNRFAGAQAGYESGSRADIAAAGQAETARQNQFANQLAQRRQALAEAPQLVETGTDPMGNKNYAWHIPGTTTLTPVTGEGGAPLGNAASRLERNYNPETGKDAAYLDAIRTQYGDETAKAVEDIADGRMPASGRNLQRLLPLAARYKQDFTAQDYLTFLNAQKSFAPGGKDAAAVKSVDQAIQHATKAWDLIDKTTVLPGYSGIGAGQIRGAAESYYRTFGDRTEVQQYASDVAEYNRLAAALGNELINAAKGAGSDVKGAHEASDALTNAKSAAEKRGAIKGAMDFLEGSKNALETKREGGARGRFPLPPLILPERQAALDRITSYREGQSAQPATTGEGTGAGAAAPAAATQAPAAIPNITNDAAGTEQYNKLRKGQQFYDPDGTLRTKR